MVVVMFAWQKLTDARGRKRTPCSIRKACISSGYAREFLVRPDETGRFWSSAWFVGLIYAILMMIFGEFTGVLLGIDISMDILSVPGQVQFWFYAISFGGAMGVINKFYGWRNPTATLRALTRAGLCASCGYKIDDIEPDADGCTVCPECGGAWRLRSKDGTAAQD